MLITYICPVFYLEMSSHSIAYRTYSTRSRDVWVYGSSTRDTIGMIKLHILPCGSSVTCFRSNMDGRIDPMCLARSARFNPESRQFEIPCKTRSISDGDRGQGIMPLKELTSYWYETGPGWLFHHHLDIISRPSSEISAVPLPPNFSNYTVLLKREGAANPWHCLMEIFSLYLTFDVLRMSRDPLSEYLPFMTPASSANTRIVIADDLPDGLYFELWTMFSKRPVQRLSELKGNNEWYENLIVPLAGASNPTWQSADVPHGCQHNELLSVFSSRIRNFYGIGADMGDAGAKPPVRKLRATFVDRKQTRCLLNSDDYLEEAKARFEHAEINAIDFASIPFEKQVKIAWDTDILVGIHGAGLTHAMFMKPGSTVVEIIPKEGGMPAFHNVASMMGMQYFRTHGLMIEDMPESEKKAGSAKREWHFEDVYLQKDRFMDLLDVAIRSMYGARGRHFDVN